MELAQVYRSTFEKAARGERAHLRLTLKECQALAQQKPWRESLFVLAHAVTGFSELEAAYLTVLPELREDEELVWWLNGARKHLIGARLRDGERISPATLAALESFFEGRSKAVLEWLLRTIDECGAQGIVFRPAFAKIKPRPWMLWQQESRTLLELITFLERKWGVK